MKRVLLILLILSIGAITPAISKEEPTATKEAKPQVTEASSSSETSEATEETKLPSIFIWQIPDDVTERSDTSANEDSDDNEDSIYASSDNENYSEEGNEEDAISLDSDDDIAVKGYLEYTEGADSIDLKDDNEALVLNLRVPQKFETVRATDIKKAPLTTFAQNVYARSDDITYNIAPLDTGVSASKGNFSIGTSYNESIDTSDLGFTTSFYTKYDRKHFSLSSAYNKESGVAYSTVVDKFSFTPEIKLNKYISIKDVLTSDITRNRKENSLILSVKPTQDDRVRFEFGAGQTYDNTSAVIKSQVKFSTQFKW